MRLALLSPLFLLVPAGCQQLDDLKDTIDGLTNPLAVQAMLLGIVEPETGEDIDLSDTPFAEGNRIQVFLADAASVANLEENTLEGASVKITASTMGQLELNEQGAGLYSARGDDGLEYEPTEDYTIIVNTADDTHSVVATAPWPADIAADIPETHSAATPLTVDLSAWEYDALLVVVIDLASGTVTYSNEPEGIRELYDFSHGDDLVDTHEVPASAFPSTSVYALGVAGLRSAGSDDWTNANTGLSSFMLGQMKFFRVSVS